MFELLLLAAATELLQLFVEGSSLLISYLLIDMVGVASGTLLGHFATE